VSLGHGPRIPGVTDGLVLYLDANLPSSYSGSGNTWYDLSGKGNHGTLINGPTYNLNGKQTSFVFDGSNNYCTLPTNLIVHDNGNPFTISVWFKTSINSGIIIGQQAEATVGSSPSGWVPSVYVDSSGKLRTSCFWGGSETNQSISTSAVNDNVFHNAVVTVSGTAHKSYLEGNLFGELTKTQTYYSATYYYFLGSGTQTSWPSIGSSNYFNGNIPLLMVYNRALSATEIQQNFQALRGRYGI